MTTITTLPPAPDRSDPATFSTKSDAFLGALDTFTTETNTVVSEVNALAAAMGSLASGAATAIPYTFSTTTTDADPGAGILRLDNATQNAATTIRADLVGSDGSTWTSLLDTFDDSTSTIKGFIMLQKASDATKWLLFSVSALASPSGYKNITVANVASSAASPFSDAEALLLKFQRNGDKGDTGATGATGVAGADGADGADGINAGVTRSARTSNTILGTADGAVLIDITSGTFTQTFTAAATLGNGWYCYIRNSGTGDITLDPNGSETIDGLTSYVMYPGECRLIMCSGSAFVSTVMSPFNKTFTTTGTFTTPPGYALFCGLLWGAGGSGGRTGTASYLAGGGGGGACNPFTLTAAQMGTSKTVTIGAGGSGQTGVGDGSSGGRSDIDASPVVYAYGGGGGGGSGSASKTGAGGGGLMSVGSTGTTPVSAYSTGGIPYIVGPSSTYHSGAIGGSPGTGSASNSDVACYGGGGGFIYAGADKGKSLYGGGGGAGSETNPTTGGVSVYGGAGGNGGTSSSGTAGTVPAGGGGGTQTGATSGAGANGKCIIWGIV